MEIRLMSDLHVEYYKTSKELTDKITRYYPDIKKETEILIVAGDIGRAFNGDKPDVKYIETLKYLASRWKNIILVPGNHEWYSSTIPMSQVNDYISNQCEKLGIEYLNKDVLQKWGYTFIGCTLWTDITYTAYKRLNPEHKTFITYNELKQLHRNHVEWIQTSLEKVKRHNGQSVVITHHLPSKDLIHDKYLHPRFAVSESAYSTDLNFLIHRYSPQIKYWFCGHSHMSNCTRIDETILLLNPLGNPDEEGESDIIYETLPL